MAVPPSTSSRSGWTTHPMYPSDAQEVPTEQRNLRARVPVSHRGIFGSEPERSKKATREGGRGVRGKRRFLGAALAASLLLVTPTSANANGGSYLEFDQTHYLPGDMGVAIGYV